MGTIGIAAGGTGGHVFPALSVAKVLQEKGHQIFWIGSPRGIENRVVPKEGFVLDQFNVKPLRQCGAKRWLTLPFTMFGTQLKMQHWIYQHKPQCILAMGGYVAAPAGIAAFMTRTPLIIHEQNTRSGMTNKVLSKFANRVLCGFEDHNLKRKDVVVTGNPVSKVMYQPTFKAHSPLRILVVGGSQGSRALNTLLVSQFNQLEPGSIEVLHQCGKERYDEAQKAYEGFKHTVTIKEFIQPMNEAYEWCDCVVSRSGAMTVTEVAHYGKPSIFIPFPHAVDNHQRHNAAWLVNKEAAFLCDETDLIHTDKVADSLKLLISDRDLYQKMAKNAYSSICTNAIERVVEECENYLES